MMMMIQKYFKIFFNRKRVEMQAKVADAFLERFQLDPEEIKALRGSRSVNVTEVEIFCIFLLFEL